MTRFRYIGKGLGRDGCVGIVLPGLWCFDATRDGFEVVRRECDHDAEDPCVNLRPRADLVQIEDTAMYAGLPLARIFEKAVGIGARKLFERLP